MLCEVIETYNRVKYTVLLLTAFLLIPEFSTAEFYQYEDSNGVIVFTDDLSQVPEKQLHKAARKTEPRQNLSPSRRFSIGDLYAIKAYPDTWDFILSIPIRREPIQIGIRGSFWGGDSYWIAGPNAITESMRLPATYHSTNPEVASVDSDGWLRQHKIGKATIIAEVQGVQTLIQVSVSQDGPVAVQPNKEQEGIPRGELDRITVEPYSFLLQLVGRSSEAPPSKLNVYGWFLEKGMHEKHQITQQRYRIRYESSDPLIVSVDANGVITAKGIGKAIIFVDVEGLTAQATVRVH